MRAWICKWVGILNKVWKTVNRPFAPFNLLEFTSSLGPSIWDEFFIEKSLVSRHCIKTIFPNKKKSQIIKESLKKYWTLEWNLEKTFKLFLIIILNYTQNEIYLPFYIFNFHSNFTKHSSCYKILLIALVYFVEKFCYLFYLPRKE